MDPHPNSDQQPSDQTDQPQAPPTSLHAQASQPEPQTSAQQSEQPQIQPRPVQPSRPIEDPYAPVIMGGAGASPRKSKKKKILLFSGLVLVLALAASGVVFGYYLPNKPENVWKTGLDRTGEALDKTTKSATEKGKLDEFSKSQITTSAELKNADSNYSGTFKLTFDKTKADGSVDVTAKATGQPDRAFGAKFLSELKQGSTYPSLYFQLNGLKTLGIEQFEPFFPGISEYDGKWVAIEEDYLRSIAEQALAAGQGQQPPTEQKKTDPVTAEDIANFARMASGTLSEYIFTSKPEKAVFEQRAFVGKENVDGMKTYHYQVGINKQHAKDFCKAIIERSWDTQLYKKVPAAGQTDQQTLDKEKADSIKSCQDSAENAKQDRTFDLWVDAKYKLIHKVRFTDEKDKNIYTEVGQNYKGGDNLSLFVTMHDGTSQSDGALTVDTNLKTNEIKGKLTFKSTKQDDAYDISATLEAKPFKDEIKVEKPAGAVPLKDILDRYGIDPIGLLSLQGASSGAVVNEELAPLYLN